MSTMSKGDPMCGSILTVKDQLPGMLHTAAVVDHQAEIADIETPSEKDHLAEIETQSEEDHVVEIEITEEKDHQVETETMGEGDPQAEIVADAGMKITVAAITTERATIAAETLLDPHIKYPEQQPLATTMTNIPQRHIE